MVKMPSIHVSRGIEVMRETWSAAGWTERQSDVRERLAEASKMPRRPVELNEVFPGTKELGQSDADQELAARYVERRARFGDGFVTGPRLRMTAMEGEPSMVSVPQRDEERVVLPMPGWCCGPCFDGLQAAFSKSFLPSRALSTGEIHT